MSSLAIEQDWAKKGIIRVGQLENTTKKYCSSPDVATIENESRSQKVQVDNYWEDHLNDDHFILVYNHILNSCKFWKCISHQQLDVESISHVPCSIRRTKDFMLNND